MSVPGDGIVHLSFTCIATLATTRHSLVSLPPVGQPGQAPLTRVGPWVHDIRYAIPQHVVLSPS